MAKPILTIGLSIKFGNEIIYESQYELSKFLNEYYVIVYPCETINPIFNVFYEKDYDEKKIEEIKDYITQKMNEIKNV